MRPDRSPILLVEERRQRSCVSCDGLSTIVDKFKEPQRSDPCGPETGILKDACPEIIATVGRSATAGPPRSEASSSPTAREVFTPSVRTGERKPRRGFSPRTCPGVTLMRSVPTPERPTCESRTKPSPSPRDRLRPRRRRLQGGLRPHRQRCLAVLCNLLDACSATSSSTASTDLMKRASAARGDAVSFCVRRIVR
jgi:hypothetical protein